MITKRQQLKWLAKRFESLPFGSDIIIMSDEVLGYLGHEHEITDQELKRERDKMQKKDAKAMSENEFEDELEKMYWEFDAERAKKSKCERLNFKMFMRIASGLRVKRKQDNSWYERGELPPVGCECEYKPVNDWVKCKVLFAGDSLYVLGVNEFEICVRVLDVEFQPLRAEREKAIDEIVKLIGNGYMSAEMANELVIKMCDAGYHK